MLRKTHNSRTSLRHLNCYMTQAIVRTFAIRSKVVSPPFPSLSSPLLICFIAVTACSVNYYYWFSVEKLQHLPKKIQLNLLISMIQFMIELYVTKLCHFSNAFDTQRYP